jgi:uncharacterized membrane protein YgaE (UPF0421/DUF939 family)
MNHDETRSGIRTLLLKIGSIIGIIISVSSAFLITQTPPGSPSRIGMILTIIVGALVCLSFFLQLSHKDTDNQNTMHQ